MNPTHRHQASQPPPWRWASPSAPRSAWPAISTPVRPMRRAPSATSATALRSRARTIAPRAPIPAPARRPATTRATPGSMSRPAPARRPRRPTSPTGFGQLAAVQARRQGLSPRGLPGPATGEGRSSACTATPRRAGWNGSSPARAHAALADRAARALLDCRRVLEIRPDQGRGLRARSHRRRVATRLAATRRVDDSAVPGRVRGCRCCRRRSPPRPRRPPSTCFPVLLLVGLGTRFSALGAAGHDADDPGVRLSRRLSRRMASGRPCCCT